MTLRHPVVRWILHADWLFRKSLHVVRESLQIWKSACHWLFRESRHVVIESLHVVRETQHLSEKVCMLSEKVCMFQRNSARDWFLRESPHVTDVSEKVWMLSEKVCICQRKSACCQKVCMLKVCSSLTFQRKSACSDRTFSDWGRQHSADFRKF